MKNKIACVLIFVFMFLSACETAPSSKQTPLLSPSMSAASSVSPSPSPLETALAEEQEAEADPDELYSGLADYYKDQIDAAEKYRVKLGGTEYYFNTSKFISIDYCLEFPLYRVVEEGIPEYLGTTGYEFQVCGQYIYIKSDIYQEDYPQGELTRIVDLKDLTVTPFGRNVDIFIPAEGSRVYYTYDIDYHIYIADPSLKNIKPLHVKLPDESGITAKYGADMEDLCEDITITKVENDWICFSYYLFEYEGSDIYMGSYRIKTNGSRIEKTDAGQFF